MSVYKYNERQVFCESFNLNGMRDVPLRLRKKFEHMMLDAFKVGSEWSSFSTPISFEYEVGTYLHEDKIYHHSLTVYYMYWSGYDLETETMQFLL